MGFICTGVEIVPEFLRTTKNTGLDVIQSDLEDGIPVENESFDIVVAHEVIEHIVRYRFLIQEIRRVLKVDGIGIVSVPNCSYWQTILLLIHGEPRICDMHDELPHHMVHLSLTQWKRLFSESFRCVRLIQLGDIASKFPFSIFPLYFQRYVMLVLSQQ